MPRHLCFYNNDTLLQDNSEPGYFTEFTVPVDTNLIVCYDDDYKITCNIRVTASSNQDIINYQYATDSALFLLKSLQNYTQNQTVRAQITVSNIAKDSNNLAQDIQNYLQNCGVGSGSSIDFSTIVTALNSITTALSALTNLSNLSNLADLANIITAITNKDNQGNIVDILSKIFTYKSSSTSAQYSSISGQNIITGVGSDSTSLSAIINRFRNVFCSNVNNAVANTSNTNKLLFYLLTLSSDANNGNASFMLNNSNLKAISDKLNNIETKLEQNLPFTTLSQVDVVTDYTQVVKGVGKSE